jgi:predicted methyltransferase
MNDLGFPSRKSIIARASMTVAMMLSVALLPGLPIAVQAAAGAPDAIAAAIANPARPQTDIVRAANRKPAGVLAFTGIKRGDKVADYAAGAGYFTRLFSDIVGPQGHVYASVPSPLLQYPNIVKGISDIQAFVVAHANANVNFAAPLDAAKYPEAQFIYKFRKP